ncbi:SH3 domain-containing protein [Geomonas sp. Red875]|uniref:SH3 domain-containing protein n=1 Tax=Geomesophilobacter sediminis TaxID=2798584 RepID=A0A8J7M3A4_9BACT|nr:SH3 domain-containing protein [Geomesophilobacter sediminis]
MILLLSCTVAFAAPPKPRPYSGFGVVVLGRGDLLVLYAEPGVQRVGELSAERIPALAAEGGEVAVAADARKGEWVRLAYDEAGREGWVELKRSWELCSWEEYLPGRSVRLYGGLKRGLYLLSPTPGEGKGSVSLVPGQTVRVAEVAGEWARSERPSGWFRWRDGDRRLTIVPLPPLR